MIRHFCALLILMISLLPAVGLASAPAPWPDCTVTLLDGTVYENVDVAWKLEGFLVRLTTADRREINLNPREIATIHDAEGRHITREVADASPSDADFAVLGEHKDEPLRLGLSADLGATGGMSGGYSGMVWSGGWFAGARYAFSERFHVRAQYSNYYLREHVPHRSDPMATWTDEVSLLLGYQILHPRRNRNLTYIELGPALVNWRERYDPETGSIIEGGDPGVGGLLRGGVILPVSSRFAVDLGAQFSLRPSVVVGADDLGWVVGVQVAVVVY